MSHKDEIEIKIKLTVSNFSLFYYHSELDTCSYELISHDDQYYNLSKY